MKEKYLNEIKEKCSKLEEKSIIMGIISMPNWYLKVDIDHFVNIMIVLGYTKEESLVIYKELLRR